MVDLKNYICLVPFQHLQIHEKENWVCCPHWLTKEIPNKETLNQTWNSKEIIDIRKSVIDGSYRYCDRKSCPYLAELVNLNGGYIGPIIHKKDLPANIKKYYDSQEGEMQEGPTNVQLNFDPSCNYKCPSCRSELFVSDKKEIPRFRDKIIEVENIFADSIEMLYSSTTGDPFFSKPIREYFQNFNPKKYPKLRYIHLHTNASLWNEKMWNTMPNIHKYVNTCEISIDAATKDTYENHTRIGGNWDNLINNLKFISTIKSLKSVKCSFVVQSSNYKEMSSFVDLVKDIFKDKGKVFFCRLQDWNSYSPAQFMLNKIHDISHPEHLNFIEEFNKICFDRYVFHNLHEYIKMNKKIF